MTSLMRRRRWSSRKQARRNLAWLEQLEPRLAMAAIQEWHARGVGGGGALFSPSINPHNGDEIYVASDMGQVFHTTNEGVNWQTVDFREIQGSHNSKVQFTVNPLIRYSLDYSTGGDFVRPTKSTDGGQTWTPLAADPTGGEAFTLVADFNDPNRILVSDYSRLFISTDGGLSFQQRFSTSSGAGLHIGGAFFDGNNIYVGTNQGVLVSTNGGQSFSVAAWSGIAGGESIVSFAGAKENGTTRFWIVTADSSDVYGGVQGWEHSGFEGLYRIDVGQSAWTSIESGVPSGTTPFFVSAAINDIDTVYVAGGSNSSRPTVLRSTTGGSSWQSVLQTVNNGNVQTGWSGDGGNRNWTYGENALGFAVSPLDPSRIVITDYGFAHFSEDGGASWRALYVAPEDLNPAGAPITTHDGYHSSGLDNTSVWGLTWTSPTHLIANNSDIRGVQSYDGGASWGFNYTGHTQNTMYRSIVHPTTGVVYAATATVHDMYQSTHLTDASINGGSGRVLYSQDGGTTWQTMHDFGRVVVWVEADPTNPNRLYASVAHSVDGGIYVTNNAQDGAASVWTRLAAPPRTEGHAFNIRVLDDGTLVASYSGRRTGSGFTASSGVFVSTDGGQSWQDRSHTGMRYWTKDVVIDPHDPSQNTWYATVFSGWGGAPNGLGGLYKTTDRGQSWTRINDLDRVNSITISPTNPNEAYLTTEVEGLWYTENLQSSNPTFTQVEGYPFMQPMRVEYNPYDPNEVWVTSFGGGLRVGYASPPTSTPGSVALAQASYTVSEDGTSLLVSVTRSGGSSGQVSVNYTTLDGTALAGEDYVATSGQLVWQDGETGTKTFSIPLINDGMVEANETFSIQLSEPTGGLKLGEPATATVTLQSEDQPAQPGIIALAQSVYTIQENGGSLLVSVVRSGGASGAVSITYATSDGTAQAGQDYTAVSGILTWADGETGPKTFSIPILNDGLFEGSEGFSITLSQPTGGATVGSPASASITIQNDDAAPILSFSSATYQVLESIGMAVVTVIRTENLVGDVTVDYSAAAGTATPGSDFTPVSGTLHFPSGVASQTFSVPIENDAVDEAIETILLSLTNPTGGAVLGANDDALLSLLDDDEPPPQPGGSIFEFDRVQYDTREDYGYRSIYIKRSGDVSQAASVTFSTSDGTASAGSDYVAKSGTITFAPGERTKHVDIALINDYELEPVETLTVSLSSPSGGTLGERATTTIRIEDNEVNAAGVIEFEKAAYNTREDYGYVEVWLQRTGGLIGEVSVDFAIAPETAQPGQDYQPVQTTVTFAAGQRYASARVYLVNDKQLESLETARVSLSNPAGGAVLGERTEATVAIADDEINAPGVLSFSKASYVTQENWGYARIYVERTGGLVGEVSVSFSVGGGSAVAGVHYQPVSGTLHFASGQKVAYFDVPLINNKTAGGSHTLELVLSDPEGGALLGATATSLLTILDDED